MADRPNILLVITDQQRFDHLGVCGLPGVVTPNLDRLAREGAHFLKAYTPSPICTPARVSLLTSRYPSTHGAWSIGVSNPTPPGPTLPQVLADAGYRTAVFGKTHFVRRADELAHVAGRKNPPPQFFRSFAGPYVGFQHARVSTGHTTNQIPDMHYRVFLEDAGVDYKPWFPQMTKTWDHFYCGAWDIPAEYHDTAWVGGNTEDWINRNAGGAPWFAMASFQDPHEPFVCPQPWYDRIDRGKLQLFASPRPGEFADKPAFYEKAMHHDWSHYDDGHQVPCVHANHDWDRQALSALQATLGMNAFIDDRVGAMLAALEKTGQADNTLVIFTCDHGDCHGHHGFWGKGLAAYDDCQRIPFLLWGPKLVKRIGTTQALANLVDLPKTILQYAGLPTPIGWQGVDLSPILRGEKDSVQDHTMVECRATHRVYQQTLVTDTHKMMVYEGTDEGELYDTQADADQYRNLWNDPQSATLKADMIRRLYQAQMSREGARSPRLAFA